MEYEQALEYMQGLRRFGIKLGNERFEALLARVDNPHRGYGVAHVAGTKGKGSTTAMIASILRAHGFRTGAYFSPYVRDVRERVQVDGDMISKDAFARLVAVLQPHVEAMSGTDLGQTTEFELKTALGFLYFAEQRVRYAAIEVGIGGRLDATNVVDPLVSVITNIGLDHTQILGDTHAKIAAEKAGIIKPGTPVITATDEPEALEVISCIARTRGSPLTLVAPRGTGTSSMAAEVSWHEDSAGFSVRTPRSEYRGLELRLRGEYQRTNAACAIAAVEHMAASDGFQISDAALRRGLAEADLPGRLEFIRTNPTVIADGAHNCMAARVLAREMERIPHRRLFLVLGMVAGHDPSSVAGELVPLAHRVFATQPTWQRGISAETIAQCARDCGAEVEVIVPPLAAARAALAAASEDDIVLITGSFYIVGDVQPEALNPPA